MASAPKIDALTPVLVRAFSFMLRNPEGWFTAAQVSEASGASVPTVYRRFGNLTAAQALRARQHLGFREFQLHPQWQSSDLGRELNRRATAAGLLE